MIKPKKHDKLEEQKPQQDQLTDQSKLQADHQIFSPQNMDDELNLP